LQAVETTAFLFQIFNSMKTGDEFWIRVRFNSTGLGYKVKKILETQQIELFEVVATYPSVSLCKNF